MSRSISVWYRLKEEVIDIDVGNHDLLGTQGPSYRFWSQKELKAFGLTKLVILGKTDPVWFIGWEDLRVLEKEILLLEKHRNQINYHPETRNRWIENLRFCYGALVKVAPKESIPNFMIG